MNGAREDAHAGGHSAVHGAPGGLAVSAAGYTLQVSPKTFEAGQEEAFGLRILDRGGQAVRDFDEQHGECMHLMVVRRDLVHYQHLHPSLGVDGTWWVPLVLPEPGVYRAFADFSVGGEHDPCVRDVFAAVVSYAQGDPARPWWEFTPERKAREAREETAGREKG